MPAFSELQQACVELLITDLSKEDQTDDALNLFHNESFPDQDFVEKLTTQIRLVAIGEATDTLALEECFQAIAFNTADVTTLFSLQNDEQLHPIQHNLLTKIYKLSTSFNEEEKKQFRQLDALEHSLIAILIYSANGNLLFSLEEYSILKKAVLGDATASAKLLTEPLTFSANTADQTHLQTITETYTAILECYCLTYNQFLENLSQAHEGIKLNNYSNAWDSLEEAHTTITDISKISSSVANGSLFPTLALAYYLFAETIYNEALKIEKYDDCITQQNIALLFAEKAKEIGHTNTSPLITQITQAIKNNEHLKSEYIKVTGDEHYKKANQLLIQAQNIKSYADAESVYQQASQYAELAMACNHEQAEMLITKISESDIEHLKTEIIKEYFNELVQNDITSNVDLDLQRKINLARDKVKQQETKKPKLTRHYTITEGFSQIAKIKQAFLDNNFEQALELISKMESANRLTSVLKERIEQALAKQKEDENRKQARNRKKISEEDLETSENEKKKLIKKKSATNDPATKSSQSAGSNLIQLPSKAEAPARPYIPKTNPRHVQQDDITDQTAKAVIKPIVIPIPKDLETNKPPVDPKKEEIMITSPLVAPVKPTAISQPSMVNTEKNNNAFVTTTVTIATKINKQSPLTKVPSTAEEFDVMLKKFRAEFNEAPVKKTYETVVGPLNGLEDEDFNFEKSLASKTPDDAEENSTEQKSPSKVRSYLTTALIILGLTIVIPGIVLACIYTAGSALFFVGIGLAGSGSLTSFTGIIDKIVDYFRQSRNANKEITESSAPQQKPRIEQPVLVQSTLPTISGHPAGLSQAFLPKRQGYFKHSATAAGEPTLPIAARSLQV